jgi:hypothetical protein
VPAELGYAPLSVRAMDATGRAIWKMRVPAQGVGLHTLVFPKIPAHAWVEVESLDNAHRRAVSRGGMP